jgi:hypothetical protein
MKPSRTGPDHNLNPKPSEETAVAHINVRKPFIKPSVSEALDILENTDFFFQASVDCDADDPCVP